MKKPMSLKRILRLLNRYCLFASKEIEIEVITYKGCYFCRYFYEPDIKCNFGHIHLPKVNCKDFRPFNQEPDNYDVHNNHLP